MFTSWLHETRRLQEEGFGVDYDKFDYDPEALADYVLWNALAAHTEISEVLQEIAWKPWVKTRGWYNREQFLDEIVDVLHFIANMAVAVGATDTEITEKYQMKMQINRDRMASGRYEQRGRDD